MNHLNMIKTRLEAGEPFVIPNMTDDEYHSLSSEMILSSSMIKYFKSKTPWHFNQKYILKNINESESKALAFGSLVHSVFLNGHVNDFVIAPDVDRRTKVGKEIYANFLSQSIGKTIVTETDLEQAKLIGHQLEGKYDLSLAAKEYSLFWRENGINFRVKFDALKNGTLYELKTTKSANPFFFSRDFFNYGYDISLAHYVQGIKICMGIDVEEIKMICVEKSEAPLVHEYNITKEILDIGEEKRQWVIAKLKNCLLENEWPSYDMNEIIVPQYEKTFKVEDVFNGMEESDEKSHQAEIESLWD